MYLKISANREFFNPEEWLKTLLFAPHWLATRRFLFSFFLPHLAGICFWFLLSQHPLMPHLAGS
jgi:hypothetical protein